ncbi:hypothetical protein ABZV67_30205 [Streptomyces sp. NPDC005065]|uniref:hypothetical protein n=1 Tax=unclassified Streptomyces TaxID=2593676 RepID=UPI0033BEE69E
MSVYDNYIPTSFTRNKDGEIVKTLRVGGGLVSGVDLSDNASWTWTTGWSNY